MKTFFSNFLFIFIFSCLSAYSPLINFSENGFTVEYLNIIGDSLINVEKLDLQNGENVTFTFQNKIFEVPVYNYFIPVTDTLTTDNPVIAMADIEGNFSVFYDLLFNNQVIDEKGNWIFGEGHLVLVGDMVDRGEFVDECLLLLYKLDYQAFEAGGRVHFILGNHEFMLLTGDVRYVHKKYKQTAEFLEKKIEDFYDSNSLLGRWIRTKNCVLKINNQLFVHAGISLELVGKGYNISDINNILRTYLKTGEKTDDSEFLRRTYGPLWYRGMIMDYREDKKLEQAAFDKIISFFGVEKIIVGHTIVEEISTDYQGKLIRIDVNHYENSQALSIKGNEYKILNSKGEVKELF